MSNPSAVTAPSKALLRYLHHQTYCISHHQERVLSKSCRSRFSNCGRQHFSTSPRYQVGSPRSYIDDTFSKSRERCKSLPPPRPHPLQRLSGLHRATSTDTSPSRQHRPGFWQRLWHRRVKQTEDSRNDGRSVDYPFMNNGNYEETSAQLFNLSRALSRNPSGTELRLRCTEFDKNGNVTMVSGEFKKSELIAKYGLLPRDLRKIDSSVLPHILVRPSAILINLLHLRVLIQSDRVLVFDAYGSTDSYTQSLFMYDLEGKLRQKQQAIDTKDGTPTYLPYEFRALEAVLISVTSGLEAEFALVREPVTQILRTLEDSIDREKLRHLLIHSKKLGTFEQKARLVRDSLDELLEADDDLATMYLSERKVSGKPRSEDDHQEVEMLLESYHKICDEVVEISGNLISNIRNTEEVVKAILDANRNQLMLFEIKVSIATLGLAGGTLIAGLYGMNLENFIEDSHVAFAAVTFICFALSTWICSAGLKKLRRVQQVRMSGDMDLDPNVWKKQLLAAHNAMGDATLPGGRSGKGSWRADFEAQAAREREKRMNTLNMKRFGGYGAGNTMGAGAGPVLWPGMEGLGLHKLEENKGVDSAGFENSNSDSDDSGPNPRTGEKQSETVNVVDDTRVFGKR